MKIAFFGHSGFCDSDKYEEQVLSIIDNYACKEKAEFLLGNYGGFDKFAYSCWKKYKDDSGNAPLIFVTPYITEGYRKNLEYASEIYDCIIYPEIEDKPKRFAICYRNRYMVEQADLIICYIKVKYGGAYQAIRYAKRLGKKIINVTNVEF